MPVVQGATADGAGESLRALQRANVPAVARGEGRVEVPASEVPRAVDALCGSATDLPAALRDRPLLATEPEVRARRELALGASIAAALRELDGVRAARVLVALPAPAPLDREVSPPPRALVSLRRDPTSPIDEARARAIVAASVDGMRPEDVRVEVRTTPPPRATGVAWVGPFAVFPSSAGPLRGALLTLLATNVALATTLLYGGLRRRRA